MRFGICCGLGSFAPQVKDQPLSSLPRLMETLKDAGADYVEFAVGALSPDADESAFEKLRAGLSGAALRVEAFNSFIPPKFALTGPKADHAPVLAFCRIVLQRVRVLGADVIVLGSGGARRFPDEFEKRKAEAQFIEFCRQLGPLAGEFGIDIAIEPLNSKEDNLINSVEDGARLVDAIAHPRIQLLADLYHMSQDKEPVSHVAAAGKRLRHTHVADLNRVAPGFAPSGEEDFLGFFRNLRKAGYDGRCSFEGQFEDIEKQTRPLLELLRKRWKESEKIGTADERR